MAGEQAERELKETEGSMKLTVHYTTQLKAELGMEAEVIEMPDGSCFSDILKSLLAKHEAAFKKLVVDDQGRLLPSILPCVDDQQVAADEDPELRPGGSVTFLSAISGG